MINEKVYNMPYKIWYEEKDEKGNWGSINVHPGEYKTYGRARSTARKIYGDHEKYRYKVAKRNPDFEYFTDAKCEICGATYQVRETPDGHEYFGYVTVYSDSVEPFGRLRYRICPECASKIMEFIKGLKGE